MPDEIQVPSADPPKIDEARPTQSDEATSAPTPTMETGIMPEPEPEPLAGEPATAPNNGGFAAEPAKQTEKPTEPMPAPGQATAQFPPNEPFSPVQPSTPQVAEQPATQVPRNPIRDFLAKALLSIQGRKRKKLDRIMEMFGHQAKITNNEVEKLLHVSDATATRYLEILRKENKIKQTGKTGHAVFYEKM